MAHPIEAVLAAEAERRQEWDEIPVVYSIALGDGGPELVPMPVPDELWLADRPPVVLRGISAAFASFSPALQAAAPEGYHGAAFFCETWATRPAPPGTAERSVQQEELNAHQLYLNPVKKETRTMWAVGRDGSAWTAIQFRGDEKAATGENPGGPDAETILRALAVIVGATTGTPLSCVTVR